MKKYLFIFCFLLIFSQARGENRMEELVKANPNRLWPGSLAHTVISPLGVPDKWKTYIEPGGLFSPGFNSFGVSYLVYDNETKEFFAPELTPQEKIESFWEDGYLPIYNSRWQAGKLDIEVKLFTEEVSGEVITSALFGIKNTTKAVFNGKIYVTLRPYGPAGGNPSGWEYDQDTGWLKMAGVDIAIVSLKASGFGSVNTPDDITEHIKNGALPESQVSGTSSALQYDIKLPPDESLYWYIDFIVHPITPKQENSVTEYLNKDINERLELVKLFWKSILERVHIILPDTRIRDAFYSSVAEILCAMVDDELRITPVSYPLFWLRDSVYMMDLLEKTALSEFLDGSYDEVINNVFLGGLGAEADAPGLGLWILGERMQTRPDNAWAKKIYPSIKEKAEVIIDMMITEKPLKAISPNYLPLAPLEKEFGIYCIPSKDGIIQGIMDTHMPLLWVNSWSLLGLRAAGAIAKDIGFAQDAKRFNEYAEKLSKALEDNIQSLFGKNERDMSCIFWPTNSFSQDTPGLRDMAYNWWMEHKEYNGSLVKEKNWLYFELAQAHNMLYLGYRDKVWKVLNRYLKEQDFPGLYVYKEGDSSCADPVGLWSRINGWYKRPGNMPHGWISAELALLIRDILYYEYEDQLIIGAGIPDNWMTPGSVIEVVSAPTYFGKLNYRLAIDKEKGIKLELKLEKMPPKGILLNLPNTAPRVFKKKKVDVWVQ